MTTDELMTSAEALFAELRELRKTVAAQQGDTATLYAWLCVLASRHGVPACGWANADAGMELTMTDADRLLWLKARESWLSQNGPGYLSGAMDITLPALTP